MPSTSWQSGSATSSPVVSIDHEMACPGLDIPPPLLTCHLPKDKELVDKAIPKAGAPFLSMTVPLIIL